MIERLDRRKRFDFAVKLEQAADGHGRDDEPRIQDTYREAKEGLRRLPNSENRKGGKTWKEPL